MEKRGVTIVVVLLILASFIMPWEKITGYFAEVKGEPSEVYRIGPSEEEQACMRPCLSQGCAADDMECKMQNSEKCQLQCNAMPPESENKEEGCVQECVIVGCEKFDFDCQGKNKEKCERECGMIKEPEARSEEEACIRECVAKVDPSIICKGGEGGEQGNEVCQRCAKECEHLYAGPCLSDEELRMKKEECSTCKHCYGEPVMGDSGEGYECIVDIECKDASAEFGDKAGEGAGVLEKVEDTVSGAARGIFGFFKNLFGFGLGEEAVSE